MRYMGPPSIVYLDWYYDNLQHPLLAFRFVLSPLDWVYAGGFAYPPDGTVQRYFAWVKRIGRPPFRVIRDDRKRSGLAKLVVDWALR